MTAQQINWQEVIPALVEQVVVNLVRNPNQSPALKFLIEDQMIQQKFITTILGNNRNQTTFLNNLRDKFNEQRIQMIVLPIEQVPQQVKLLVEDHKGVLKYIKIVIRNQSHYYTLHKEEDFWRYVLACSA